MSTSAIDSNPKYWVLLIRKQILVQRKHYFNNWNMKWNIVQIPLTKCDKMSHIPWPTSEFYRQSRCKLIAVHFKYPLLCLSAWGLCPASEELAQHTCNRSLGVLGIKFYMEQSQPMRARTWNKYHSFLPLMEQFLGTVYTVRQRIPIVTAFQLPH